MVEQHAVIKNQEGIHCRPSSAIIKSIAGYPGNILVRGEHGESRLTSVLELMAMELAPGAHVTIRVEGPDEEAVCRKLVTLFETEFDFPPQH